MQDLSRNCFRLAISLKVLLIFLFLCAPVILHLVLAFRVARLYASGQQTLRVKVWYKYFLVSRSFSRKLLL
jgi:ABC-type spermidine/putrescine transport system permease subunit II